MGRKLILIVIAGLIAVVVLVAYRHRIPLIEQAITWTGQEPLIEQVENKIIEYTQSQPLGSLLTMGAVPTITAVSVLTKIGATAKSKLQKVAAQKENQLRQQAGDVVTGLQHQKEDLQQQLKNLKDSQGARNLAELQNQLTGANKEIQRLKEILKTNLEAT